MFRSVNIDTRALILSAYRTAERRLFASQIVGAPAWLATDRYDINAKVNDELASKPQAELFGMLPLPGHLTGGSVNLETLTSMLSGPLERVVLDRTALTGTYDFDLEWSPDQSATDKPSIFVALEEQLGLKLESARDAVDVLVIDHVERPTED